MTDIVTTDTAVAEPDSRLGAVVSQAWREHNDEPVPQTLLAAFLAAAHAPTPAHEATDLGHLHGEDTELADCHTQLADQLRQVHEQTRLAQEQTAEHRKSLRRLRLGIRIAALGTLDDNPRLEERLCEALADWELPPIPTEHTVTLAVPLTVTVNAADTEEAVTLATARLREDLSRLSYGVSAAVDNAESISVETT